MTYEIVNPTPLGEPRGWNNGMLAPPGGRVLFVAGQTARDGSGRVPEVGLVEQFERALAGVLMIVREAGGSPEDIGRLTVYVTDMDAYRKSLEPLGAAYRARMGRHYPAMALVEVRSLVDPNALVEIEAMAILSAEVSE
jgi:enamine deaminase RidA (YjgF/YER057c/UK114 family)